MLALVSNAVAAPSADETAIRAQSLSWEKAYNGGDAKGVAAQYADDALLLPPGASGVSGKAAILDFFTKDIAGSKAAGSTTRTGSAGAGTEEVVVAAKQSGRAGRASPK